MNTRAERAKKFENKVYLPSPNTTENAEKFSLLHGQRDAF